MATLSRFRTVVSKSIFLNSAPILTGNVSTIPNNNNSVKGGDFGRSDDDFQPNYQVSKVKLFCSKYYLHKIKYPLELAKLRGGTTTSSGF